MKKLLIVFVFFYMLFIFGCENHTPPFSCRNRKNEPVDTSVTIKRPGFDFYHSDPTTDKGTMLHFKEINQERKHPIWYTWEQIIFANAANYAIVLNWNDQPLKEEDRNEGTRAHAKGILVFFPGENNIIEDGHGFYFQHSCPQLEITKEFPKNCLKEAQHFFCMNIKWDGFQALLRYIYIIKPNFVAKEIPKDKVLRKKYLSKSYYLKSIVEGNDGKGKFEEENIHAEIPLTTPEGKEITIFAKSIKAKGDQLWIDITTTPNDLKFIVISHYGKEVSKPTPNDLIVAADTVKAGNQKPWPIGNDHCKFALTNKARICFGDINYMVSMAVPPEYPSGGIFCFDDQNYVDSIKSRFTFFCNNKKCF